MNTSFLAYSRPNSASSVRFGNESNAGVKIERVTSVHTKQFDDFVKLYNLKPLGSHNIAEMMPLNPGLIRSYLEERTPGSFTRRYVAYDGGKPAGAIDARRTPWNIYVEELIVDGRYDGRRKAEIAQDLLANLKRDAQADGVGTILMQAYPKNIPFYESLGFKHTSDKPCMTLKP